jgi:hydrogenase-1 operon protein HyaE
MTIAVDTIEARHPLIAQLFSKHGFSDLQVGDIDLFAGKPGHTLLVFTEDPVRVRETLDLAVIAPEVVAAFPGRFRVGVLLPEAARAAQARFGVRRWPALVILRDGAYVGAIEGLRNWDEYVQEFHRLLDAEPSRPPTIGVAVKTAGSSGAACGH